MFQSAENTLSPLTTILGRVGFALILASFIGCSKSDLSTTPPTSTSDIEAFIEQNPQFADSPGEAPSGGFQLRDDP